MSSVGHRSGAAQTAAGETSAGVLRTGVLLAIAALLAGCVNSFVDRSDPPVTYVLRPSFAAGEPAGSGGIPLKNSVLGDVQVGRVSAAPGYATEAILATLPDRRLDVFAASRWPATLPDVIETLAVQALRAAGIAAHTAAAPVATTHMLAITVQRFDAEYRDRSTAPVIKVTLEATLSRRLDRQVLEALTLEAAVPAAENRMESIVAAFEIAAGEALSALPLRLRAIPTGMSPERP